MSKMPTPPSHWNYRVLRTADKATGEVTNQIHEVYYNDGVPTSCTLRPVSPCGETIEELHTDLQMMVTALQRPVIDGDNWPTEIT